MAIYKLKDIAKVRMCRRVLSKQRIKRPEIPFFTIGSLGSQPDSFITYDLFNNLRKKYNFPKKNDTLISTSGTICKI